jgi:hypothetical protein
MRSVCTFAVLCIACAPVRPGPAASPWQQARQPWRLQVVVRSPETRTPLHNATVTVAGECASPPRVVLTDAQGRATADGFTPGHCVFVAQHSGAHTVKRLTIPPLARLHLSMVVASAESSKDRDAARSSP